jgi:hypothetical protein
MLMDFKRCHMYMIFATSSRSCKGGSPRRKQKPKPDLVQHFYRSCHSEKWRLTQSFE